MSEKPSFSPDQNMEGGFDVEKSKEIRDELFVAYEKSIIDKFNQDRPPVPEEERKLEDIKDDQGKVIAHFDNIRGGEHGRSLLGGDSWIVLDFDDVMNFTSEYMNQISQQIQESTGISEQQFKSLYDAAKEKNEFDKNVFRVEKLVNALKEQYPDNIEGIDEIFDNQDYSKFLDQGALRSLMALRNKGATPRVSVLTFGDLEYQKKRVEGSGLTELLDDVIYTEGSKRETLEKMVALQYPPRKITIGKAGRMKVDDIRRTLTGFIYEEGDEVDLKIPNIITVDDSPAHIEDYDKLSFQERYANIRYRHPLAKRFGKEHVSKQGVGEATETEGNQGALALYNMFRLGTSSSVRDKKAWWSVGAGDKRDIIFDILEDPDKAWDTLHLDEPHYPHEDIRYHREGDEIVKEWTHYPTPHEWGTLPDIGTGSKNVGKRSVRTYHNSDKTRDFSSPKSSRTKIDEKGMTTQSGEYHPHPIGEDIFDAEEFILSAEQKI